MVFRNQGTGTLDELAASLTAFGANHEFVTYVHMVNMAVLCPSLQSSVNDITFTNILHGYAYWHFMQEFLVYCVRNFSFPVPGMSNTDAVGTGLSSCDKVSRIAVQKRDEMAAACTAKGLTVPNLNDWFFQVPGVAKEVSATSRNARAHGSDDEEEDVDAEEEGLFDDR